MNWGRVLRYIGLAFLATFIAGFIPGAIRGVYKATGSLPPDWTYLLQTVLGQVALFLVFVRFARIQHERTRAHAAFVLGGTLTISLLNLFLGQSLGEFFLGIVIAIAVASAGVEVGLRTRPELKVVAE